MRLLGIDFGFKRIGIAIAESDPEIVSARASIEASGVLKRDAERLAGIARDEKVDAVVIGLPVEESGEEGRMARICRRLGDDVERAGLRVELVDERFTSVEADSNIRNAEVGMKASQRRKLKDGESARLILQRFLSQMRDAKE